MPFTIKELIAEAEAEGRREAVMTARRLARCLELLKTGSGNYLRGFRRGMEECLTALPDLAAEREKAESEQPAVVRPICPACKQELTALASLHGRTLWGHRMSDECLNPKTTGEMTDETPTFDSLGHTIGCGVDLP